MQDAFNNDGVDGFEVEILESITDVDGLKKSLKIQESFWITQYLNSGHNFFNVFASNTFEGITYRGWQADLARRLEISPVSVTQKLSGATPRQIPPEQMHIYLDALGLELMIKPKSHE